VRPVGKFTKAACKSALEALEAADQGGAPDRLRLLLGAQQIIRFVLSNSTRDDIHEVIPDLANLSITITTVLDQIVLNSSDNDPSLHSLRNMAKQSYLWPTMVRPHDRKLTERICERLGVGTDSIIREAPKPPQKPASFNTTSNRFTAKLLRDVFVFSGFISGCDDDADAIGYIKSSFQGIADDNAKKLLCVLREIIQSLTERHQEVPLTKDTVKSWNRWLPDFVLSVDPELVKYPELKQVSAQIESAKVARYSQKITVKRRSALQKFFSRALKNMAK
jgi:hypothetical protein